MTRYVSIALGILASGLFLLASCSQPELAGQQTQASGNQPGANTQGTEAPATEAPAVTPGTKSLEDKLADGQASNDTIIIGSFNLMNFGKSKMANDRAMDILAKTLHRYDLAAVQEIENLEGTAIIALRDRMNALQPARRYEVVVGERVGTNAKEQYAFIYDTTTINYTGESYTFNDAQNKFERPPFVARFTVTKGTAKEEGATTSAFDFALVNIHTKPDNATTEIMALEDVIIEAQTRLNEKDVIALGDYNAGGSYFNTKTMTSGIRDTTRWLWIIPDGADTTLAAGNENTYDRIVAPKQFTEEDYAGNWNVFRFDREYGIPNTEAKTISDHYAVEAVFFTTKDSD